MEPIQAVSPFPSFSKDLPVSLEKAVLIDRVSFKLVVQVAPFLIGVARGIHDFRKVHRNSLRHMFPMNRPRSNSRAFLSANTLTGFPLCSQHLPKPLEMMVIAMDAVILHKLFDITGIRVKYMRDRFHRPR
jgi:hypothetical protein